MPPPCGRVNGREDLGDRHDPAAGQQRQMLGFGAQYRGPRRGVPLEEVRALPGGEARRRALEATLHALDVADRGTVSSFSQDAVHLREDSGGHCRGCLGQSAKLLLPAGSLSQLAAAERVCLLALVYQPRMRHRSQRKTGGRTRGGSDRWHAATRHRPTLRCTISYVCSHPSGTLLGLWLLPMRDIGASLPCGGTKILAAPCRGPRPGAVYGGR